MIIGFFVRIYVKLKKKKKERDILKFIMVDKNMERNWWLI